MLLYSTLLCKKIAPAPGGHKRFMVTKLGGRSRIDPYILIKNLFLLPLIAPLKYPSIRVTHTILPYLFEFKKSQF